MMPLHEHDSFISKVNNSSLPSGAAPEPSKFLQYPGMEARKGLGPGLPSPHMLQGLKTPLLGLKAKRMGDLQDT